MSQSLRVLIADSTDPYFNLAVEDWIFNDMLPDQKVLFLWRNDKSIILGRGQNVWSECDLEEVKADGVNVVRRHSGGGAVYQDLGNSCFTFMGAKEQGLTTKDLYARNNRIILRCLAKLGVEAEASGRNDLVVPRDGHAYKISGSAFKESKDRCFHHGTMLMRVDLQKLSGYLTPDSKKLRAKGIKSVKSRVMNLEEVLPEIDHELFARTLINEFFAQYQSECPIEHLNSSELAGLESVEKYYQTLKSWDWIYGKTPSFETTLKERFSWGGVEIHLDAERGRFTDGKLYTDSLEPHLIEDVPKHLVGHPYTPEGVKTALASHQAQVEDPNGLLIDLYGWLETAL